MILLTFPLIATSKSEDDPPEDFTVKSEELNVTDKANDSAEKMRLVDTTLYQTVEGSIYML